MGWFKKKTPEERKKALDDLKAERVKLEGEAKLAVAERNERMAISRAKQKIRGQRGSALKSFVKGFDTITKEAGAFSKSLDAGLFGSEERPFKYRKGRGKKRKPKFDDPLRF